MRARADVAWSKREDAQRQQADKQRLEELESARKEFQNVNGYGADAAHAACSPCPPLLSLLWVVSRSAVWPQHCSAYACNYTWGR